MSDIERAMGRGNLSRRRLVIGSMIGLGGAALSVPARGEGCPPSRHFLDVVADGDLELAAGLLAGDPGLLHVRDAVGRSAYTIALLAEQKEMADWLLGKGHRPDAHEAALAGDWQRFEALAEAAPTLLDRDHPIGGSAMAAAALGGAGRRIWRVYLRGGSPNARPRGTSSRTPLRIALELRDPEVARNTAYSLLGNGADPNPTHDDGTQPLHVAAARGFRDLVEMLIRCDADVGAKDGEGRSAQELATENGHAESATLLARHEEIARNCWSSRRAYDREGRPYRELDQSVLSLGAIGSMVSACHFDAEGVARLLQASPALARTVGMTTESAVEASAHMGRQEMVEILLDHGAAYSLPTAVMMGDEKRVKALLEEDPRRIHERGAHDFALLLYPIIGGGLLDMAELLFEAGAEVERQHSLGTTALHWASRAGQMEMVALLLDHGADPNRFGWQNDPEGLTPLRTALSAGHSEIATLLRDRGARPEQS